jgi:pyruvate dehydrogenase E1 component beta subunit
MFGGQMRLPLVYRAPGGGGRQLGPPTATRRTSSFSHFPGLKVVSRLPPTTPKGCLKAAIRTDDPVLFIEHAPLRLPGTG